MIVHICSMHKSFATQKYKSYMLHLPDLYLQFNTKKIVFYSKKCNTKKVYLSFRY